MSGVLLAVSIVLIVAVPWDLYVAYRFVRAAMEKPYIPILTLAAVRSVAIAIAATIFGLLGLHSVLFLASGETFRLLPVPVPTLLLAVGAIVISVANIYVFRVLRGDER
jgi:hypothetical protein